MALELFGGWLLWPLSIKLRPLLAPPVLQNAILQSCSGPGRFSTPRSHVSSRVLELAAVVANPWVKKGHSPLLKQAFGSCVALKCLSGVQHTHESTSAIEWLGFGLLHPDMASMGGRWLAELAFMSLAHRTGPCHLHISQHRTTSVAAHDRTKIRGAASTSTEATQGLRVDLDEGEAFVGEPLPSLLLSSLLGGTNHPPAARGKADGAKSVGRIAPYIRAADSAFLGASMLAMCFGLPHSRSEVLCRHEGHP